MSDVALTTYVYRIHAHGNWEQTLDLDEAKHLGQLLIEGSRDEYLGEWLDDTGDICIARTPTSSPAADFLEDTEVFMQAVISPVIQDGVTYYRYDMMPVEPRRLRCPRPPAAPPRRCVPE